MDRAQVLIVGAGLAGLTAARRLVEAGRTVRVLEARDRVGGRTYTAKVHGAQIERGGQWIGPGQPRMADLVAEFGLHTFPTPAGGAQVLDRNGRISRYTGTIPPVGALNLIQLQAALSLIEHMRKQVPPDAPWTAAKAEAWDSRTLASLSDRIPSPVVRDLLVPAIRTVFGAEPGELSLLHFLAYVSSADGFMRLLDVQGGFQQDRILEGAQTFSERLADRIGRDHVRLRAPVRAVDHHANGVTVTTDAGTFAGDHLILAVPPPMLSRVVFTPGLPPSRAALHQRCAMGATVKIYIAYKQAFWRDQGMSGEAVCTHGPISVCFDNTAPGGPPMLLAFVVGRPARTWAERDPHSRRAEILDALTRWFGQDAAHPEWYEEMDWSVEPWTEGCPIAELPPGTLTGFGEALRRPVGRIHWAGTETARVCTGFMEGAVESGERAASEVLGTSIG